MPRVGFGVTLEGVLVGVFVLVEVEVKGYRLLVDANQLTNLTNR